MNFQISRFSPKNSLIGRMKLKWSDMYRDESTLGNDRNLTLLRPPGRTRHSSASDDSAAPSANHLSSEAIWPHYQFIKRQTRPPSLYFDCASWTTRKLVECYGSFECQNISEKEQNLTKEKELGWGTYFIWWVDRIAWSRMRG